MIGKEVRREKSGQEHEEHEFLPIRFLIVDFLIVLAISGVIGVTIYFAGICAR